MSKYCYYSVFICFYAIITGVFQFVLHLTFYLLSTLDLMELVDVHPIP